ncbi:FAD/NAD(P)-binding domain-containing protein [Mycena venus]|uniref:FAD/NAD(P)-binding domain-containing protein n=1 Tax=Mycena venus TaxID=2733690 RepID=A0A8H7CSS3_9AGAR|nr:FAD/NAD(P)-binding domain-containing protein [Mycena venus]
MSQLKQIIIVGAGLSGLTLALALTDPKFQTATPFHVTLYELRARDYHHGGAIMLSPNSLRLYDKLGVYDHLKTLGYNFEKNTMTLDSPELVSGTNVIGPNPSHPQLRTGEYLFGAEAMFGYQGLRIYRQVIIDALFTILDARPNLTLVFSKQYTHVVSETESDVTIAFADGDTAAADLLIGTDGIHSKIRSYVVNDDSISPKYTGIMSVVGAVSTALADPAHPESITGPISVSGASGVYVIAPQGPTGSDLMAGTQIAYTEQDQAGWRALMNDGLRMKALQEAGRASWASPLVKNAIEHIKPESMYVWPFYMVPEVPSWISRMGKVIIIGDAAHALPPTLGQGANQAVEDAYSLVALLTGLESAKENGRVSANAIPTAVRQWQHKRQERVDRLKAMTAKMNNNRLPAAQKEGMSADQFWAPDPERPGEEMRWLYDDDIEGMIQGIFEGRWRVE